MEFEIDRRTTAVVVFDMINDFLEPGAPFESPKARELVPRLKPLLASCRKHGVQVIYTNLAHRSDRSDLGIMAEIFPPLKDGAAFVAGTSGVEVYEELAPQPGDIVVNKLRFGPFEGTELELVLRQAGIDTIVVVGTSASIGIESTARAAVDRDFKVVVPSDGTVNKDLPDLGWGPLPEQEMLKTIFTMLSQFCRVTTIDGVVRELGGD